VDEDALNAAGDIRMGGLALVGHPGLGPSGLSIAEVVKLVDAPDSKSGRGNSVGVRFPPSAPSGFFYWTMHFFRIGLILTPVPFLRKRHPMVLIKKALFLGLFLSLAVNAFADEWDGVTPEDMGISQEEFQKVKESGMSKVRFLKLLEVGISPNEYFSEPWKKLGVSEEHWLNEKKAGMADDDIDRSYRKQNTNNLIPFLSFILPGYYQYKINKTYTGLTLSTLAAAGIVLTIVHQNPDTKSIYPIYPIISLGAMLWSAGEAYMGTRYVDNQEASRFSFDFGLNRDGAPGALLSLSF
jgi:hypothetical protein